MKKRPGYEILNGRGITATTNGIRIYGGNRKLMKESGISGYGFDVNLFEDIEIDNDAKITLTIVSKKILRD